MALYCLRDLDAMAADAERIAVAALGDPDVGVRLAALSTLPAVAIDGAAAARRAASSLDDPDAGVRRAAAAALGKLGVESEEAVTALRAVLPSADPSLASGTMTTSTPPMAAGRTARNFMTSS